MLFADMRVSDITIIVKIPLPADTVRVFEDRPQCGLLFVEYGSVYYEQEGKKYLSDGSHVLFIPKGIDYSLHCTKKSMSYVINFDVMDTPPTDSMQNFELAPQQEMYNLLSDLDRAWTFKQAAYEMKCMSGLYELLFRIDEMTKQQHSLHHYGKEKIARSLSFLEAQYCNPDLSNDLLAAQSNISTAYFRKLFQDIYGTSPMRCVHHKRMEKAKAMLLTGYMSISEIASAVGFSSIYHFSRAFKQMVGMSPRQYLYQSKNNE